MNGLTLRQATTSDSEFAYRVKKAAYRECVEKVWGWDEDEQRQFHERRFAAQDFRVINLDGTDVGVLALVVEPDCLRVNQLFLLPEHQGKGIGRECMLLIMEEARRLGLSVRLQVLKVNPRALAFYQRLGFVRIGETDSGEALAERYVGPLGGSPGGAIELFPGQPDWRMRYLTRLTSNWSNA